MSLPQPPFRRRPRTPRGALPSSTLAAVRECVRACRSTRAHRRCARPTVATSPKASGVRIFTLCGSTCPYPAPAPLLLYTEPPLHPRWGKGGRLRPGDKGSPNKIVIKIGSSPDRHPHAMKQRGKRGGRARCGTPRESRQGRVRSVTWGGCARATPGRRPRPVQKRCRWDSGVMGVWAASRHRAGPGPGARATPSRATSAARPLRTGPNYARTRLAAAPDLFGKPGPGPFPAPATGCTPLEETRRSGLARERRTALPPQRPRGAAAFAAAAGPSCRLRFPSSNPRPAAQALRKLTTPQAPIRVAGAGRAPSSPGGAQEVLLAQVRITSLLWPSA